MNRKRLIADIAQQDDTVAPHPGLPYLYLPRPDPTAVDLRVDARATLSFSEARARARSHYRVVPPLIRFIGCLYQFY